MTYPLRKKLSDCQATELAKGVLQLANQLESKKGINAEKAITPATLQDKIFNKLNTSSGIYEATLNSINGTIYYEGLVTNSVTTFVLNNSNIVAGNIQNRSKIFFSVEYESLADEYIIPCSYSVDNVLQKVYFNIVCSAAQTSQGFYLNFTILNP